MSWTDWAISIGLIALVLRQLRGRQLTPSSLMWPVGLVVWAGFEYLGKFPSHTSDWIFAATLSLIGLALGLSCGLFTRVYPDGDQVTAKATKLAAVLWILGMASRLAFGILALHGGEQAIARLSDRFNLHSADTWPTALITMALCEVLSRTGVLLWKYHNAAQHVVQPADKSKNKKKGKDRATVKASKVA